MHYLLSIATVLFLFSCQSKEAKPSNSNAFKLISSFRPAFAEASEITFNQTDSIRQLSIVIRNNPGFDEKEDTFYHKTVALNTNQTTLIQGAVLNHFNSPIPQKESTVRDGMSINFRYTKNQNTAFYTFHSPLDSVGYRLTTATLDTYQSIFRDTLVSDYFNDLRTYIYDTGYIEPKVITPLKQMREIKYAGKLKYSR